MVWLHIAQMVQPGHNLRNPPPPPPPPPPPRAAELNINDIGILR